MKKRRILGSFVSTGSFKDFIEGIFSFSEDYKSSYICVCNVHMLVESEKDLEFNEILNNADITTPDGMPVAKLLSWKYKINQERISGMDLLPELIKECAQKGKSIYFYGSTNQVLGEIQKKIQRKFQEFKMKSYSPPFRSLTNKEEKEIINDINNFNPDFIFVALGCPKQEIRIKIINIIYYFLLLFIC